jgi:hypothetical protein
MNNMVETIVSKLIKHETIDLSDYTFTNREETTKEIKDSIRTWYLDLCSNLNDPEMGYVPDVNKVKDAIVVISNTNILCDAILQKNAFT